MIEIKKIVLNNKNFSYFFNIILLFRNDNEYCKINSIKKVKKANSFLWLKENCKNRIFFLIKYKHRNAGIINFNKKEKTFSQVIKKKYRNLGIGKISFELLLKYLKKMNFKIITTYVLNKNVYSYKLHSFFCYKKKKYK